MTIAAIFCACNQTVIVPDGGNQSEDSSDSTSSDSGIAPSADGDTDSASDAIQDTEEGSDVPVDSDSDTDSNGQQELTHCDTENDVVLVCNNFEDNVGGELNRLNGTVGLTTDTFFTANSSLRAYTYQEGSFSLINHTFDSIESGTIYFRAHMFIPVGTTVGRYTLLNLAAQGNSDTDNHGIDVNVGPDLNLNIYQHGNFARFPSDPGVVPEGEWFCLRGSYVISTSAGATRVLINDNLVASTLASPYSIINNGVGEVKVGIAWTELEQVETTVFVDNLLVATQPVFCLPSD